MTFRFLTAGESHGPALTAIIEGVPANLKLSPEDINFDLIRRQKGHGRGGRMKIEKDNASILSGVRHGLTLGSPITLQIENKDWQNWTRLMSVEPVSGKIDPVTALRPGHADLSGTTKYHQTDIRNILERASARETATRVAVGAVAKKLLAAFDIHFLSWVPQIGPICGCLPRQIKSLDTLLKDIESSPVRTPDREAEKQMIQFIDRCREEKTTCGGVIQVIAFGLPVGLGSHVHWDRKLDGRLAQAIMSIPAIKGVDIGLGFASAIAIGHNVHDAIRWDANKKQYIRDTNNAGGLEGGITNGEPLVLQAAMKPIATLLDPLPSVDIKTKKAVKAHVERSDICAVPAAAIVAEAMTAIVLADAFLEKYGGDSLEELKARVL